MLADPDPPPTDANHHNHHPPPLRKRPSHPTVPPSSSTAAASSSSAAAAAAAIAALPANLAAARRTSVFFAEGEEAPAGTLQLYDVKWPEPPSAGGASALTSSSVHQLGTSAASLGGNSGALPSAPVAGARQRRKSASYGLATVGGLLSAWVPGQVRAMDCLCVGRGRA